MRVLGIEGTAWAASAAVYDSGSEEILVESEAYRPASGGINPSEAAEHMREAIPRVVEAALDEAAAMADAEAAGTADAEASAADAEASAADGEAAGTADGERPPVDAVAFSRGPGLGPCLRIVGTAARSLAMTLDVPLVGVNHMVAHLEIGRHESGFDDPVCLNASGANAHVLAFRNGRYRVLGETMDTGVGNALDKFTRHVGWQHPGGPKVEEAAKEGEYVDLPYVVKGMDFSFSGIMSAAKQAYDGVPASEASGSSSDRRSDGGTPVADVCFSLQENVFGMLAEVSERALSLTGSDELVLGGGVGQNARLRGMLSEMCEARGAEFHAPDARFLRDNAGMIAVLGAKMAAAGDTIPVEESRVDPDFRPDEVEVTWRRPETPARGWNDDGEVLGAEATVEIGDDTVVKRRLPKRYRHPVLDERLRRRRTREEARLTSDARRAGVPTPVVCDVDLAEYAIEFERVGDRDLRAVVGGSRERDESDGDEGASRDAAGRVRDVGRHLAACHDAGFVHGDPTTRNVRVESAERSSADTASEARDERSESLEQASGEERPASQPEARERGPRTFLIDFGLGYYTDDVEDYAMDLHVFAQSLAGTADDADRLLAAFEDAYRDAGDPAVLDQVREIEGRGRYQDG